MTITIRVLKFESIVVRVWNNPKCHGCLYEFDDLCQTFKIHTRSDDVHCLFCVNNLECVLPIKNYYKTMEELLKQTP